MIDRLTLDHCKENPEVLILKINNLEFAIKESESMIKESIMDENAIIYLRRKIADSLQDLEVLYLLKKKQSK